MGVHKRTHILRLTELDSVAQRWQEVHGSEPTEEDVDAMFEAFVPTLLEILPDYCEPIPGVLDAVAAFREGGLKVGSSTGYTREMMEIVVPEAKKRGYAPDSVVCSSDVPAGRPSPWMALRSAMELGVYPMEAIVKIGDTVPDVNEGLNAGMWTIGLTQTGNEVGLTEQEIEVLDPQVLEDKVSRASQRLAQAGVHYVIDGLWDVLGVLDEIELRLADGERP
jgi:phosphonoacetaldehyde hydrolase